MSGRRTPNAKPPRPRLVPRNEQAYQEALRQVWSHPEGWLIRKPYETEILELITNMDEAAQLSFRDHLRRYGRGSLRILHVRPLRAAEAPDLNPRVESTGRRVVLFEDRNDEGAYLLVNRIGAPLLIQASDIPLVVAQVRELTADEIPTGVDRAPCFVCGREWVDLDVCLVEVGTARTAHALCVLKDTGLRGLIEISSGVNTIGRDEVDREITALVVPLVYLWNQSRHGDRQWRIRRRRVGWEKLLDHHRKIGSRCPVAVEVGSQVPAQDAGESSLT